MQSFCALRETLLEELDLEEPDYPLLISGGRRAKLAGSAAAARRQERQRARQDRTAPRPRIDQWLGAPLTDRPAALTAQVR
ncbi:MAG TPA: hypothetical protein VHI72_15965 [Hyphomicrobiaceae bacterium]|nr:hypothetical protein [Hyphomicrobiaceae bacterium]